MKKPELLSPAGSLEALHMAFAYGADAVYAGLPRYSLRVRSNEFNEENLIKAITATHQLGRKIYLVVNLLPHNAKLTTIVEDLRNIVQHQPDGFIVADPGILLLLREHFPQIPLHLSVQANTMNWAAVRFWQDQCVKRIILSRELSLEELSEIRTRCPDIELEVFVHGSLCMAYSGRCLISGYMNKRDANQGACTNACRWQYQVQPRQSSLAAEFTAPENTNEPFGVEEDEHGSYLFNSRDLRAVALIEQLTSIGIDSFKIEGRTKSAYYAARTAQVYRKAIDLAVAGQPFDNGLLEELNGLSNRGYTTGFLQRHTPESLQQYERGHSCGDQQFVGKVSHVTEDGFINIEVKNAFCVGDELQLVTPDGNFLFRLKSLLNKHRQPIERAPGDGHTALLSAPENYGYRGQYALLAKRLGHAV